MKFAFSIGGCLIFLFSCKQQAETTRPTVTNITESVYASGKVKSRDQYEVYASVTGLVQDVHVKESDLVRKGDVIITLANETSVLNAENARLNAQFQAMQANLDKLNEAEANVNLAKTRLQNDSALLQRQRHLWANEIGSRYELEQKELAVKNSGTVYQTAILRYRQ